MMASFRHAIILAALIGFAIGAPTLGYGFGKVGGAIGIIAGGYGGVGGYGYGTGYVQPGYGNYYGQNYHGNHGYGYNGYELSSGTYNQHNGICKCGW